MIAEGIYGAVGNTPLVRLRRAFGNLPLQVFAKLEGLNPGGSAKDRPGLEIISRGLQSGRITSSTVVIESSSGNLGIGLAQACRYHRLRFICVTDPKACRSTLRIIKAYGAEIDLVAAADPETGEYLPARLQRVQQLLRAHTDSYWCNQYANVWNAEAHHATMREIAEALDGQLDYLICGVSSCGTLRGCADYASARKMHTAFFAVDVQGSAIFNSSRAPRLLPGLGSAIKPVLLGDCPAQRHLLVTEWDCVEWCRRLLRDEAMLVGASSGGVCAAFSRLASDLRPGATCVLVLPDRGERYLDTVFSDEWIAQYFPQSPAVLPWEVHHA